MTESLFLVGVMLLRAIRNTLFVLFVVHTVAAHRQRAAVAVVTERVTRLARLSNRNTAGDTAGTPVNRTQGVTRLARLSTETETQGCSQGQVQG